MRGPSRVLELRLDSREAAAAVVATIAAFFLAYGSILYAIELIL